MKLNTHTIGNFGDKNIPIEIHFPHKSVSNKLVILFHGCGSKVFTRGDNHYQILCHRITNLVKIPCAIYESSRHKLKLSRAKTSFLSRLQKMMPNKTLEQELNDTKVAIDKIQAEYFQRYQRDPELIFIGFSLGGIIATHMSVQYHALKIITFGTALKFKVSKSFPIIGTAKAQMQMRKIASIGASKFSGDIIVIRGNNDKIASSKDSYQFMNLFKHAKSKSYLEIKKNGHRIKIKPSEGNNSFNVIIEMLKFQIR